MNAGYAVLFNVITDTIEEIDRLRGILVAAQQKAEEAYLAENPEM